MKVKSKTVKLTAGAIGLAIGLAGCTKKKSGDDAPGETPAANDVDGAVLAGTLQLQLADTINIIPAKTNDAAALSLTDLDDAKARVNYRVHEKATEGLNQVQGIMCFLAQTRYAEMANQGAYVAMVNESKCFKDGDSSKGARITRVKIESTRPEGKALEVKLWLPADEHNDEGMQVLLKVAEGSSATNPVGIFRLQFGKGYMESRRNEAGEIEVVFFEDDQRENESWSMKMAVRLDVGTDGEVAGGRMVVDSAQSYNGQSRTSAFNVVFNGDLINRSGTSDGEAADACIDRNQYTSRAWNYNVYKADGALWALNSGFPIEWTEEGATKQGWASFWGISGQGSSGLPASVTAVNRVDYSTGAKVTTPYTVTAAPGKLYKNVRNSITLGELKGAELRQYTMDGTLLAKWDGTNFVKIATVKWDQNGETRTAVTGNVDPEWNGYRFHVDSLGGDIFIPEGSANDSFKVSYFQRSVVSGTDSVPTGNLVCFDRCIEAAPTAEAFQQQSWGSGAQGPYVDTTGFDNQPSNTAKDLSSPVATYSWDATTHNIKLGDAAFTLPSGLSSDSNSNSSSHQTGALVSQEDYDAIADKASKSPYDLERLVDVYYQFETGTQSWSKYTALVDADGKVFQFDQPINITYVHSKENDLNDAAESEFYGQTFSLQYGGPGSLWGFPMQKDEDSDYQTSKFGLAVGATLADGSFVVPVEVEQILTPVDAAQCAGVPIENLPELPSAPAETIDNGTEPSDDTPVKVVDGQVI